MVMNLSLPLSKSTIRLDGALKSKFFQARYVGRITFAHLVKKIES